MVAAIKIGDRTIGHSEPCFIIAEAGVNHNGNLDLAYKLVDVAVEAGADAVKFQTFWAERIATPGAPKAIYQKVTTKTDESQLDMLKRLELTPAMHESLSTYCAERDILFLSSPFDELSAEYLVDIGLPLLKIPSGEITNIPFLEHVARLRVPLIVSTGMSTHEEVHAAVETIHNAGCDGLVLLHCVSNYPADPVDTNLRAMHTMREAFNVLVGFSDHTLGIEISLAAVALGSCVIEKHFTLDRALPGPDHRASLEPEELNTLVLGIRNVEMALGDGIKQPVASELDTTAAARKSIVAKADIPAGRVLGREHLALKRPGTGISPARLDEIIGLVALVDIHQGALISLEMLKE